MNRIICGDALATMKKLKTGSIKAVVTSPPYNLKNSSGNGMKDGRGGKWSTAGLLDGYDGYEDCMPASDYIAWQRACLTEMMRLIPEDGAIFYNHKWRVQKGLIQDRSEIMQGFPVRQIIIWHRKGGFNFNPGYFLPTYEVIYLIAKPKFKLAPKTNAMTDVWEIKQEANNPHPAPFPVELALKCIQGVGEGTILDPFIGSGSTAIAANMQKNPWIGIDKSKLYCAEATARIAKEKLKEGTSDE